MKIPKSIADLDVSYFRTFDDPDTIQFMSCHHRIPDEELNECVSVDPCSRIIKSRLESFTDGSCIPDDKTIIMMSLLSGGVPGVCVMEAWWAHRFYVKHGRKLSLADMTIANVPIFPTKEVLKELWDDQKENGHNALDRKETWST
jgi:hypothetical protein